MTRPWRIVACLLGLALAGGVGCYAGSGGPTPAGGEPEVGTGGDDDDGRGDDEPVDIGGDGDVDGDGDVGGDADVDGDGDADGDLGPGGAIWRPAPGTSWQWQLTGEIDTSYDVDMYDIDLFDADEALIADLHAGGRVVICYFSAGSREDWRPDADEFPDGALGNGLDGWPGEVWLDTGDAGVRAVMSQRMDLAADKDCDGVEPDNVDGYSNDTGFPLTERDQLDYNRFLASEAHARGLSVALKNDLDQVQELVDDFDFALNEECFDYDECETLLPFIDAGKAVFQVSYGGQDVADRFCQQANELDFDALVKDLDLGPERIACR